MKLKNTVVGLAVLLAGSTVWAGDASQPWYFTVYLQESFPKQTNTNKQIEEINHTFGVNFDTWDDVHNLNLGLQLFRQVSRNWKLGLQVDYSKGSIDGKGMTDIGYGPMPIYFEQEYSLYADLYAVAHYLPCPDCQRWVPFIYGGIGVAYEKDETTLSIGGKLCCTNREELMYLRVKNDGYFPSLSAGAGVDAFLSQQKAWYVELGVAYVWARLDHNVAAEGPLAPSPKVRADTDTTGANYWIGIGKKF